ncbi:MAG: ABC transporter substrate-binding protein [Deltaproteobacteria bacterium]|nr:ABC transporter substrate-binding protein [Deltaproteobacteria bacterium]
MKLFTRSLLAAFTVALLSEGTTFGEGHQPPTAAESGAEETRATVRSDLAEIQKRGKIVMLTVPWQENLFVRTNIEAGPMQRKAGPEFFEGSDVDLMSEIARELGVELEIVPAMGEGGIPSYSALIPALLREEGDVIASAFSVTATRREKIDFSAPYFHNQVVIITRKGPKGSQATDLAGLRAAIIPQTSLVEDLAALQIDGVQRVEVDIILEAYEAVSEGRADFLLDYLSSGVANFLSLFDNLEIARSLPAADTFAIGLRPGSDLEEPINQVIEKLRSSGRLEQIMSLPAALGKS